MWWKLQASCQTGVKCTTAVELQGISGRQILFGCFVDWFQHLWLMFIHQSDGWSYFTDPDWANYPVRFYRLRSL